MLLFVLESIGTQELVLIAIAALVLFGPRKLPELGRMLGKSLAEFRRASDDFKRTWQQEVEIEEAERQREKPESTAETETVDSSAVTSEPAPPPLVAKPAGSIVARGVSHETEDEPVTTLAGKSSERI